MGKASEMPINSSKVINAWCSYDMANSGYTLSIGTVLYPIYYESVTRESFGSDMIHFFGLTIKNTVLYEYAISFGYLITIIITLMLSGIADLGGYRKRFMQFFTLIGAIACMGMYCFVGDNIILGITLPALAIVGFAGSLVYYNSFLPLIATPDKHDKISAKGFSFGYAGSMLLLLFILYSIENYQVFGFSTSTKAVRFAFIEVGIWWLLISQFAFYYLKEKTNKVKFNKKLLSHGFIEIRKVFKYIKQHTALYRFLIAFFFFSVGVQTIMIVATLFGSVELGIETNKLIMIILIIQVTAIAGASLFGWVSSRFGNKKAMIWSLLIWIVICVSAYYISSESQFLIMGSLTGFVMGGIQSQARSIWSKFIPSGTIDTASYFSFYDSTEKLAIVVGMFSFGLIEKYTGNMRISALSLSLFFIISLIIIFITPFKAGSR